MRPIVFLCIYVAAECFLLLAPGKWGPERWIGIVCMAVMILMVLTAHRVCGQCKKCGTSSTVLYDYRCIKCRNVR